MSDRTITLRNPADDSVLQEIPLATAHDIDHAVARAHAALPAWRDMAPNDRIKIMRRFAETIAAHAQELAELDTRNMGMPIGSSKWCADTAAEVIHYYAGGVDKHLGHTYPVAGGVTMTFHEPLGVVGLQVVNVAHGGTLIQDLGTEDHRQKYHPVNLTPDSKVAQAIGANQANACHSFHHQAIDSIGQGFVVSGRAIDGTIEAIESSTATWCVAVQWHPEDSAAEDQQQQNLFDALIKSVK